MSHLNHESIKDSKILSNWGVFVDSERKSGPNERYDSETGQWGTKAQALGGMINNGGDEDDEIAWTIEGGEVDNCWIMQEVIQSQHADYKAILFGWFCEWRYNITACMDMVHRKPMVSSKSRYTNKEDFIETCNKAIAKAEKDYAIEKSKQAPKRSL